MVSAKRDLINAILLLIFSGIAYLGTTQLPIQNGGVAEADLFPNIVISILVILSICLFIQGISRLKKEKGKQGISIFKMIIQNKKIIYTFGLFSIYILLLPYLGYFISSVLFLNGLYMVLTPSRKRLWLVILFMIGLVYLLYLVFQQFLSVYLPSGIFF